MSKIKSNKGSKSNKKKSTPYHVYSNTGAYEGGRTYSQLHQEGLEVKSNHWGKKMKGQHLVFKKGKYISKELLNESNLETIQLSSEWNEEILMLRGSNIIATFPNVFSAVVATGLTSTRIRQSIEREDIIRYSMKPTFILRKNKPKWAVEAVQNKQNLQFCHLVKLMDSRKHTDSFKGKSLEIIWALITTTDKNGNWTVIPEFISEYNTFINI